MITHLSEKKYQSVETKLNFIRIFVEQLKNTHELLTFFLLRRDY